MAKGNIRIFQSPYGSHPTWRWQTEAAATDIKAGEPVKLKSAGSPYVIPLADADLTLGTDVPFIGVASSDSTHTASVDGKIDVYIPLPGTIYEARVKTSTTADTQSEIDALCGDRVVFDLTSSVYTVDAAAGDGVGNALLVVGGDPLQTTLRFTIGLFPANAVAGA